MREALFLLFATAAVACSGSAASSSDGAGGARGSSSAGPGSSTASSASSSTSSASSASSASSSTSSSSGCTTTPTFAEVLATPLSNCAGAEPPCHNDGTGDLTINPKKRAATWGALVNVPASWPDGGVRVVPGDPGASFLYKKLTNTQGPNGGSPMPEPAGLIGFGDAGPPMWMELPASDIEMVRCWIAGGAVDN